MRNEVKQNIYNLGLFFLGLSVGILLGGCFFSLLPSLLITFIVFMLLMFLAYYLMVIAYQ